MSEDFALYVLTKSCAGVRELARFVSRVPSNHGHVVWHPEPFSQDIPPWVRHSTQVSVSVLGNPVQSELSKQLLRMPPRRRPWPWRR